MEGLVARLAALECGPSCDGLERDLRVIETDIARAEEKVQKLDRASCWRPAPRKELL